MNNRNLIPDWAEPKAIMLIWPEHVNAGRGYLSGFSLQLIRRLADFTQIEVLFSTGNGKFMPPEHLNAINNVRIHTFEEIGDIWARDYSSIWVSQDNTIYPVKAEYAPMYLTSEAEKRDGNIDDVLGYQIAIKLSGKSPEDLEVAGHRIKLDGGNLSFNGQGAGITTNRIISENEHIFIDDLRFAFKQQLGIEELHIIPSEPGDNTGHVDGLARFINPSTVIVSEYPYNWKQGENYISEEEFDQSKICVDRIAEYFINKEFNVFRMPNAVPEESKKFESAVGNYTNFLMVGKIIFIPEYGNHTEDDNAKAALIKAGVDRSNIIGVPDCRELASKGGGVLNCITSHIS